MQLWPDILKNQVLPSSLRAKFSHLQDQFDFPLSQYQTTAALKLTQNKVAMKYVFVTGGTYIPQSMPQLGKLALLTFAQVSLAV